MIKEIVSGLNPLSGVDLLLINSPLRDYDNRPKDDYEVLPPLGLAYIATQTADQGQNIGLIDAEHYGLGQLRLTREVNRLNPRFVGINVFTPAFSQALSFAKELNSEIPIIIGGPHATALAESTLRAFSAVHKKVILIISEAEFAVSALLDGQNPRNIPGAFWLEKDVLCFTPGLSTPTNLDKLPQLDRKYLVNDPSIDCHTGKIESRVLTSRGCPFNCTICAGARDALGLQIRNRQADNVAKEIQGLVFTDNIQSVRFIDDLFISSEKRARAILDAMTNFGINGLLWDATGRASILARFSSDFFDYIKQRGAHEIAIGIESGSERIRAKINKQVSTPDIDKSIYELTSRGIKVKGYFVIGIPTESKEETLSTLNLAKTLTQKYLGLFRASIFIFRPYPGTQEWKNLIKEGFKEEDLMSMYADGKGERAKHEVLTTQQFSESTPQELSNLLANYDEWQRGWLI